MFCTQILVQTKFNDGQFNDALPWFEKTLSMKRVYLKRDIKSKQFPPPPQYRCIFLTILSVNPAYNFSELHLSYSLNFPKKIISVKWISKILDIEVQ